MSAPPIIEGLARSRHSGVRHVAVDADREGQRLDNFLLGLLKGVPKTHVYRLIRSGQVRVNKGRARASARLAAGDVVRVPPVRQPQRSLEGRPPAPAREFCILLEDDRLLALDKPAGVAVHGGSGVSSGVIEQLRSARPGARMLELVHRLDRGTSGVLLVAKRRSALRALQEQFRQRTVRKTYLCLVLGDWPQALQRVDTPLRKERLADGTRHVYPTTAADPRGKPARTRVRVRQRWPGYSLLEVTIETGRTHQIRVHLAASGHPVAGDDKYGDFARNHALRKQGLQRMFLHAWRLQFAHPASGQPVTVEAALPDDLPAPETLGDVS